MLISYPTFRHANNQVPLHSCACSRVKKCCLFRHIRLLRLCRIPSSDGDAQQGKEASHFHEDRILPGTPLQCEIFICHHCQLNIHSCFPSARESSMRFPLSSGTKQSWKLSTQGKNSFNNRPGLSDLKCQFSLPLLPLLLQALPHPISSTPSSPGLCWPCRALQGELPCAWKLLSRFPGPRRFF